MPDIRQHLPLYLEICADDGGIDTCYSIVNTLFRVKLSAENYT